MPVFNIGEPILTDQPTIQAEDLPEGDHTFELEVEDDRGQRSDPDRVVVRVRRTRPTARLSGPEGTVELGNPAPLDGRASTAVEPAVIRSWGWTLVDSQEPGVDQ